MGFGYLFVGYLFFFNFTYYHVYSDIFGILLMLLGLSMLQKYAKGFKTAFYTGIPLAALALLSFVSKILELFHIVTLSVEVLAVLAVGTLLFKAIFLWFVFTGVAEISKETRIPVLQVRAWRNRLLTIPFYALGILLETNAFATVSVFLKWFVLFYMLFGLLYAFFNAKTLFESYVWICLEGDENMERKESRFGVINKLNEISDRLDQKTVDRK